MLNVDLRKLSLKPRYNSGEVELLHDLWIPLLSNSILYKRGVGYFRSDHLAAATKGLVKFIENGGKALIICGVEFTSDDILAIKQGYINRNQLIESKFLREISSPHSLYHKNSLEILAWMVKENDLNIKIAIRKGGEPGIFHSKFGLCYDDKGNSVAFEGSANETAGGLITNRESISLDVSWNNDPWIKNRFLSIENDFDRLWENHDEEYTIMEFPEAVKLELLKIVPKNRPIKEPLEDSNFKTSDPFPDIVNSSSNPALRGYQIDCIKSWLNSDCKGMIEMATGTGKTFVAIACIGEIITRINPKNLCIVIVCPYIHLIDQWNENLIKFNYSGFKAYGNVNFWKLRLGDLILTLNSHIIDNLIILTTYNTFSSDEFIELMIKVKTPLMLIADEVHSAGSQFRREGLLNEYKFRIGLSATPKRYFDDEGTNFLFQYFGNTVYEFSLEKAIREKYLVPYEYHPYYVDLTDEEFDEYRKITKKMAKYFSGKEEINLNDEFFKLYAIQRQKIIVNSSQKLIMFKSLINQIYGSLDHCLIYCSERQIDLVQEILNSIPIISQRITYRENIEKRNEYFENFDKGIYKAIVAINILDEGVDIPSTKMAILLSSSGNPKQYIQRRGRVLRPYKGKDKSIIYDIFVIPSLKHDIDENTFRIEQKIVAKELKRHEEMAMISLNKDEAIEAIQKIKLRFKLF